MGRGTPLKYSFNAGELSPLLDGRTEQAKYYSGASICENFLPTVQGPIIRRGGTYFTAEVKTSANRTWLRRFYFNVTQSYILEFGDQYIRFYTNRGAVLEASKNISNASQANPCVITCVGHGLSTGNTVYIAGVTGMTQLNGKYYKITVLTPDTFSLQSVDGTNINSATYSAYVATGTVARVYEIASPYVAADLTDSEGNCRLSFRQSGSALYITHNGNTYQQRKLSRLSAFNWTLATVDLVKGPFKDVNSDSAVTVYASAETGTGITLTANSSIFQAGHVGSLFYLGQPVSDTLKSWEPGKNISSQETRRSGSNYYQAETVTGSWSISAVALAASGYITFTTNHALSNTDYIFVDNIVGTTELNGNWYAVKVRTANSVYLIDPDDGSTKINTTSFTAWSSGGTAVKGKKTGSVTPVHSEGARTDGDPGVNWTYLHSGFGIARITGFTSGTVVTADVVTRLPVGAVGSGNPTPLWAHSLFSSVEGWPELVSLFRERLSFIKGLTQVFSVAADYENFANKIGGVVTSDAAIKITLPDTNPARWMIDGNDQLVGTAGRELAVGKVTTTDPLGPSNIEAKKQTSYGSRAVEPVEVGASILFVTRSGRRLREIVYDWTRSSYVSSDLTILSEHIAREGLNQICFQQEPYGIVWGCTADGQLVGLTFNREQDVIAWHRHPVGGSGFVESVQSIPSPDGKRDDLWLIVRRTINGVTRRYVEYMVEEFEGDDSEIADAFYVDAGLTYDGASTTTIKGLDHLLGCTVDVLAGGGYHPQVTVSTLSAGVVGVTLNYPVTKAQIGLPCPAKIRTMRTEAGSQLGTAQGKVKRITRLLLRLLRSLGGKFGPDMRTLDELNNRDAGDAMDAAPAMLNGDRALPFPGGHETDGYVVVYNDKPFPMTIVSLVPDLVLNEN